MSKTSLRRVGVDASTMEANPAMRSIVRREDGAGWQTMLGELARTSGIATRTNADRLLHRSHVATIRGDSYRLREKRRYKWTLEERRRIGEPRLSGRCR